MKNIFLLVLFAIIFISCTKTSVPTKTEETISELPAEYQLAMQAGEFLDDWHQSASEANFDNYFNAIGEKGIFIGTDKTEVWSKEEFANFSKPYFDKGKAWSFKSIERNLYIGENNRYLWFDEILDTWMGTCRGSGVVKYNKENNQFEIEHYVLSLAVPNEKMQQVIETIQEVN